MSTHGQIVGGLFRPFSPNAKSSLGCHMDENDGIGVSQHPSGLLPHRGCDGPHTLGGLAPPLCEVLDLCARFTNLVSAA